MFCLRRAIADIFHFWLDMILCIYIYFICMASSKCFLFITNLIYIMAKKKNFWLETVKFTWLNKIMNWNLQYFMYKTFTFCGLFCVCVCSARVNQRLMLGKLPQPLSTLFCEMGFGVHWGWGCPLSTRESPVASAPSSPWCRNYRHTPDIHIPGCSVDAENPDSGPPACTTHASPFGHLLNSGLTVFYRKSMD